MSACDCKDCPPRRELADAIAGSIVFLMGVILGLLLGLAVDGTARQQRAEQIAECLRVSAEQARVGALQDRAVLAASAQIDAATPLCAALADLRPSRVRWQR